MNRSACILFVTMVLLPSCDDYVDPYMSMNNPPILYFNNTSARSIAVFHDSVKVGFTMEYNYHVTDEETLFVEHDPLEIANVNIRPHKIKITGVKEGMENIRFWVTDGYGQTDQLNFHLTIYHNLLPVARLSYTITAIDKSHILELNASNSFDQDKSQGGAIERYMFKINSFSKTTKESRLRYSVNKNSTYQLQLKVMDNNDAWSEPIITYITI